MSDIRRLIDAERRRQGRSIYWLAVRVAERRKQATKCVAVYQWLGGKFDATSEMIEDCAAALGCEILLSRPNQPAVQTRTGGSKSTALRISSTRTKS